MNLETLLEAAMYLEYQAEATRKGEVPKDYKTYSALQNSTSPSPVIQARSSLPPPPPPPLPPPVIKHVVVGGGGNSSSSSSLANNNSTHPPPIINNHHHHNHHHQQQQQHHSIQHAAVNGVSSSHSSPPPSLPAATTQHYTLPTHDGSYLAARLTAPAPTPPVPASSVPSPVHDVVKQHHISNNVGHHQHLSSPPPSTATSQHYLSSGGDISPHDLKRRIGAGTREVHNKLEKNRRAHLKECFELLRRQLPASHEEKKPSNLSVLHSALRYIQSLKRKERDYEHDMERLAREKIACQQRLSALKKELSAQWDHIDFATLLPEAPPTPSAPLAPTLAAHYSRPRTFDSDDDFEFDDDEDDMRHSSQRHNHDTGSPNHSASTSTASERGHTSDVEDLTMSSRPGSSRELYSSPPPPAPSLSRPSVVEPPRNSLKTEVKTEIKVEPVDIVARPPASSELLAVTSAAKLHVSPPPHLHLQPQLVAGPGLVNATGATLMGQTIQLLAPSLRMITPAPDHRVPVNRVDEANKGKLLGGFLTTADPSASRLPGGAEINVVTSSTNVAMVTSAALVRAASKPMNLSAPGKHQVMNGGVISHAPSTLHRPALTSGMSSGTTVLTTMHGSPATMGHQTVTHHLSSATGITHVVTAAGAAHLSALAPLVAGPVTMMGPGPHHPGVHILAAHPGKSPFQVVSGPLLKATHQVLPAQYLSAASAAQLVKPVVMLSSPAMAQGVAVAAPQRPTEAPSSSNGGP